LCVYWRSPLKKEKKIGIRGNNFLRVEGKSVNAQKEKVKSQEPGAISQESWSETQMGVAAGAKRKRRYTVYTVYIACMYG